MARKRLRQTMDAALPVPPKVILTGDVVADVIALGTDALAKHMRKLIRDDGIRVIVEDPRRTRIRVCAALDYVVDRSKHSVWAEAAPMTSRERHSNLVPPWHDPTQNMKLDRIDLLNPLCKPLWLGYVAARPG